MELKKKGMVMEKKYKKDPHKIGRVAEEIILIIKKNELNIDEIEKLFKKLDYEINHRTYIHE
ncbi:hypothetical protein ACWG0P_07325 [Amedibacillus sp. YH-ame6]